MTVVIRSVNALTLRLLISADRGITMTEDERRILDRCLLATTSYWAGTADDRLICVWGLIPPTLLSDRAYLWLYTTEAVQDHVFLFVRYSQRMIEDMLQLYPTITGHVVSGNARSARWLRWLGATFLDPEGQLIPFEIKAKHG